MRKTALWISSLTLGLFFVLSTYASAEVIKNFRSEITVNTDGSVSVIETIVYDSEGLEKHGIYRDITPRSSDGKVMAIKDVVVTDPVGTRIGWQRQTNNGDVRLKIGDPNVTFNGIKTYVVGYTATNAIAHLQNNLDEIYWNATGNAWPFSIEKFTAQVTLPNTIHETQNTCYTGVIGSTEQGCGAVSGGFASNRTLLPGEGATVAVGFPAGVIHDHVPTTKEKILAFLAKFWPLLIPVATFIYMYRRWSKKGRDPKGTGVITAQYDVPDGLTPMEVTVIVHEKMKTKDISAEIVYLATRGYIKITQTNEKIFGLINNKDYTLTLLKGGDDLENEFDKKLIIGLFGENTEVALSSLKNSFFTTIPSIESAVNNNLLTNNYYTNLPKVSSFNGLFSLFPVFVLLLYFPIILQIHLNSNSNNSIFLECIISFFTSLIIYFLFQRLMPAKSMKGVTTYEYLLGLKEYLQIAEKDRLNFHNAPDKRPEIFEKLLPYAMIFGVEKAWAKEFEGIYTQPPSWYGGYYGTFNAASFSHDMSSFSTSATNSLGSSPSSGGSSGGGFSGGGGGGGGGGSW